MMNPNIPNMYIHTKSGTIWKLAKDWNDGTTTLFVEGCFPHQDEKWAIDSRYIIPVSLSLLEKVIYGV